MSVSGTHDIAASGVRGANALTTVAPNSKALPRFFKIFFAIFFDTLSPFSPGFLKKSPRSAACIVLSEIVIDCFLFYNEQCPINTLLPLEVISPTIFVKADLCFPPTQLPRFEFVESSFIASDFD